jgi:signal transduction histidine kinase
VFVEPMYDDLDRMCAEWQPEHADMAEAVVTATAGLRDEYPYMVTSARDGCDDIREMVSEIADYIKGAQATNFEVGDISKVLDDRLRRLKVLAANRRVMLHLEVAEDLPPFAFDRRLVGRAVFNLVNNALGAISDAVKKKILELPHGGFNVWVHAGYGPPLANGGPSCRIEVRDDGPGIPLKVRESLFTQNAISTTPGGTGIGTRFVKSVADAHGGAVSVESEQGKGASFRLDLPLRECAN